VRKIANIVSDKELSNHKKLDWINYVVLNGSPLIAPGQVPHYNIYYPSLIVGWDLFRKNYPEYKPDILDKTTGLIYNVEWEFSAEEKLVDHFEGIQNFIKTAPRKFAEKYPYRNIDPIADKIEKEEEILEIVRQNFYMDHVRLYQYKDEIIYLYSEGCWKIFGIYLNAFRYFKYDVEKIKTLLYAAIPQNQIFLDPDGQNYGTYYKQFPDFDQLKRSMVLFLA